MMEEGSACPNHDYEGIVCDICEEEADEDGHIYHFDGKDLCFSCLKDRLPSKPETDYCDECGTYDRLWLLDGEWLCEDCLLEVAKDYAVEDDEALW